MLEKLFGGSNSHISDWLVWRWANEHPYLYTVIEVCHSPYILIALVFIGIKAASKVVRRHT